jgi:hypothetical protein
LDREKKLLIRAALAEPSVAVPAWTEWRADFAGPNASNSLAWAGGYVYKNLLAAGVADAFAKGIYRHNWLSNTSKKSMLIPTLREISKITPLLPLKTFGFSHAKHSLGLRPIADFDIFVNQSNLEAVATRLVELKFLPIIDLSLKNLLEKIRLQRGSWNFKDPTGNDLDLHWKAFDHISEEQNERILKENSSLLNTEFGPANYMNSAMSLASQIYVHALQGENRYNGLFDMYNNTRADNFDSAAKIIRELDFCDEAGQVVDELMEALDISHDDPLAGLGRALRGSPKQKIPTRGIQNQRLNQIHNSSLRFPKLYRAWVKAGANPVLERLHSLILGPMTNSALSIAVEGSLELKLDKLPNLIPVGFHYQYPLDQFRWAHKGDARVRFRLIGSGRGGTKYKEKKVSVTIDLDMTYWGHTPTQDIQIYCHGREIGSLNKTSTRLNFAVPIKTYGFELSFRSSQIPDPLEYGIQYNIYQMLCPIKSISVSVDNPL